MMAQWKCPLAAAGRRLLLAAALVVPASLALAWPASAAANARFPVVTPESQRYADCMRLARTDPGEAEKRADAWHRAGGGDAALHCIAVALLGLGEYREAARTLENLAQGLTGRRAALRAEILAQAGNAWTLAHEPDRAYQAQSEALALKPDDVDLLIDRGITLASTGQYWEALDDLNRALSLDADRPEALVFRASAWRHLGSLDLAADDTTRALALSPGNPDALLERGMIHAAQGHRDEARADWLAVVQHSKTGRTREAAQEALQTLDLQRH